ncbi:hypothetical protein Q9295_12220, partial [Xinfangfangia sp. CPCC 101601]|nr:hypothetical protein [Xinfangfangia sp. CPCC 101601]
MKKAIAHVAKAIRLFILAMAVTLSASLGLISSAYAQGVIILEDFEGASNPLAIGYDSLATAFGAASSTVVNYRGTAGYFRNGTGTYPGAGFSAVIRDTPFGQAYSAFHRGEVVFADITAQGGLVQNTAYQMVIPSYQLQLTNVSGPSGLIFNTPGVINVYGVRTGTTIPPASNTFVSADDIDAISGVDYLGSTTLVNNTDAFANYNISFTATQNYDRLLLTVMNNATDFGSSFVSTGLPSDQNNAFLAIDRVQYNAVATLQIQKSVLSTNLSPVPTAGDTIEYQFVVTNTGNVTLNNVTPVDNGPLFNGIPRTGSALVFTPTGPSGPVTLVANAARTFTATYTLTAQDALNLSNSANPLQSISNSATASGNPIAGVLAPVTPSTAVTGFTGNAEIRVVKAANVAGLSNPPVAGQTISYTMTVQNTGNLTLNNVTLADTLYRYDADNTNLADNLSQALSVTPPAGFTGTLAPNATAVFTVDYQITQADIDAGGVLNTALVTGITPAGANVSDESGTAQNNNAPIETPLASDPALVLTKTADVTELPALNGVITYTFEVENTGNVTLSDVSITDTLPNISAITPASVPSLAPGATTQFTATYTVTQADIDAGQVVNTATADATAPGNVPVNNTDSVSVPALQAADIALVKAGVAGGAGGLGDTITYTF